MSSKNQYRGAGRIRALVAGCVAIGLVLAVMFSTGWRTQQAKFGDFLVQLSPKPALPFGVALVGIDPSSLNLDQLSPEQIAASPSLTAMKQGYPWSRAVYADAIRRLVDAGARLVFLDVLMRGPREGDDELREILKNYGSKVVLVSTFAEDASGSGQAIVRYQPPAESLSAGTNVNVGFANFWRDEDQVVRLAPFRLRLPGTTDYVPSAPAVMLGLLAGEGRAAALPAEAAFIPGIQVLRESMLPLWKLFDADTWEKDLKNGAVFRDKVVAIGAYFSDAHDEFTTPAEKSMPGVAMHIGVLAAAWQGAFYSMPGAFTRGAAAFLAALAALIGALVFRNILVRSVAYAAGILLITGGGIVALVWLHIQIPLLPLLSGLLLGGVATLVVDLVAEGRARLLARRMLESYFSPKIVREMLDKRESFLHSIGGSRREVTVLVSDLRGFTSLAELAEPADLITELNDYLGRMTALIFECGGGVDKFLGDGILAVWGTLEESEPESTLPVLECSKKMLEELRNLNRERVAQGKPEWHLGIGIHRGPVIFGNVGSPQKKELTVIGDTVNLASRTESLNKAYGTEILFTRSVYDNAGSDHGTHRSVDRIRVVGRTRAVDLYTVWDPAVSAEDRNDYEKGVEGYRAGNFSESLKIFQKLHAQWPADSLSSLYATRCRELVESPPEGPWDGISQAKSK